MFTVYFVLIKDVAMIMLLLSNFAIGVWPYLRSNAVVCFCFETDLLLNDAL